MAVTISKKASRNKQKIWYSIEWGKAKGQRIASGVFTYAKPKDQLQKNHNKEALAILESKRSQMILDQQAIGSGYIPSYKLKSNFLDYYSEYVTKNSRKGNRHLAISLKHFKKFMDKDYIPPIEITETVCEGFRSYLLQHLNGETPADYYYKFKKVLKAAKSDGYFLESPAAMIKSKVKPNKKKKEMLEAEEYIQLIKVPCLNHEIKRAFVFCLYSGLRWCDVKPLKWENIRTNSILIEQEKTGVPVEIPLHPVSQIIAGEEKTGLVFKLPTADGANKALKKWCQDAGLNKHITWNCARLSFSVLLQDEGVNTATVAGMLGHTSTKYVERVYQRYRVHIGRKAIQKLPLAEF